MFQKATKIILSIIFLLCLLPLPYGYYQFARFMGLLGFVLLAYYHYLESKKVDAAFIIYISFALLFQPFLKISLGRTMWNITDVIVSIGLIISIFVKTENRTEDFDRS